MHAHFPSLPAEPHLAPDEVHVVRLPLAVGAPLEWMWAVLDEDERRRASRFVREDDRRRFVVAHGFTRLVLGRFLRHRPESLRFDRSSHGKPSLAVPACSLQFSLAHSGELGLLAVSSQRHVGVDVEQQRPLEALNLSRRFFSDNEHEMLRSLPSEEQLPAFYRCWTRKESFIKALGVGLSFPLAGFEVGMDTSGGDLLRACPAAPDEATRWKIESLPIDDGYQAALTAEGKDWRVLLWNQYTPAAADD
jgi:4'-phosphopantetheinyl transferase